MAEQTDKPADAIPRVAAQQRAEAIAHAERKRHAARTMEKLKERFGALPDSEAATGSDSEAATGSDSEAATGADTR
ncbi:hypothetical protein [Bradyrhizobium sp. Ash2021]|uniref:hypothetical protein n=1 Tax=Bradyrhizobium sp. Ash2021 TaxID=2954771 RepID=UPI002814F590|nr:hypothetical protein [Bradyrhizobium sp. Ash2021]WMT75068.1 hypothetical protein NL528_01090 [Bradyrhizobium sp. Ash2021]